MTTLEEAKRCPKCQEPGDEVRETGIRVQGVTRGARLKIIVCRNSRCKWFETEYYIQVNPDGTVPPPIENRRKMFEERPSDEGRTERNLLAQIEQELLPGAELRGRY